MEAIYTTMAKEKVTITDVVDIINLTSTVTATASNTEKTMDLSSFKHRDLLKSSEKLLIKNKINNKH
jgi:hypothetical protein